MFTKITRIKKFWGTSLLFIIVNLISNVYAATEEEQNKAYAHITLSNIIIELTNKYQTAYSNIITTINHAESNVELLKKSPDSYPLSLFSDDYKNIFEKPDEQYQELAKFLANDDEAKIIIDEFDHAHILIDKFIKSATELEAYYQEKQYTKDNFAQYKSLIQKTKDAFNKAEIAWNIPINKAVQLGKKAELLLSKDNPLVNFIIPMQQDLQELNYFYTTISQHQDLTTNDLERLKKLEISINTHKNSNQDWSKLSDIYYKEVYSTFYIKTKYATKQLQEFISQLNKKVSDESLDSFFEGFLSSYNKAVEEYNTFIQQQSKD